MMNSESLLVGILSFLGALAVTKAIEHIKDKSDKSEDELKSEVKKNTDAVIALNLAIVELKVKFEEMSKALGPIQKMQHDINYLHGLRRKLEIETKENE